MSLSGTSRFAIPTTAVLGAIATLSIGVPQAQAALLVGNTAANNVLIFDERTGKYGGEFISNLPGSPDDLTFGPNGDLFISVGNETSGAILRFSEDGTFLGRFDQGGILVRPYGVAFGPDGNLYVSSFRSDEIARYDGVTGNFIDIFATGTNTANGLNGPNDLLFGDNGDLYVTTQGSVALGGGAIDYRFASQVLRYNIFSSDRTPIVFDEPATSPGSVGFVSLLGLAFGTDGDLFVSDFANAIRRYDPVSGTLLDEFSSTSFGFMGNLTFDPDGNLYTVGFDFLNGNIGSISRFDSEGNPFPAPGQTGSILVPTNPVLQRPIGIAYIPTAVPEPTLTLGLLGLGAWGAMSQRKRGRSQAD
jgi:sugar lactone lactonase YvrE